MNTSHKMVKIVIIKLTSSLPQATQVLTFFLISNSFGLVPVTLMTKLHIFEHFCTKIITKQQYICEINDIPYEIRG